MMREKSRSCRILFGRRFNASETTIYLKKLLVARLKIRSAALYIRLEVEGKNENFPISPILQCNDADSSAKQRGDDGDNVMWGNKFTTNDRLLGRFPQDE